MLFIDGKMENKKDSRTQWDEIYQTPDLHRAEMLKDLLKEQGLQAVVLSKKDSTFHWGNYVVYVEKKQAHIAKDFIDKALRFA